MPTRTLSTPPLLSDVSNFEPSASCSREVAFHASSARNCFLSWTTCCASRDCASRRSRSFCACRKTTWSIPVTSSELLEDTSSSLATFSLLSLSECIHSLIAWVPSRTDVSPTSSTPRGIGMSTVCLLVDVELVCICTSNCSEVRCVTRSCGTSPAVSTICSLNLWNFLKNNRWLCCRNDLFLMDLVVLTCGNIFQERK